MSINDHLLFCPKQSSITKTYLELTDIHRLQQVATNQRDCLLIRLLFHLGCRVSEILGITLDNIDTINNTITIQHLKLRIRLNCPYCNSRISKSHTFCPRCGTKLDSAFTKSLEHRRVRTLPINEDTMVLIKDYISSGDLVPRQNKIYLFGISRHRVWQIVKECAERAHLPKLVNHETGKIHNVSPHKLRDAFAVHAMKVNDSGDGLRLLQQHLGHASFNATAKYRKISGEEHRQWYQRLWDTLDN